LKHGYYSQRLRKLDVEGAEALKKGVKGELALLRALLQEFVARAVETGELVWLERALELAGRTSLRILTLEKVQEAIGENEEREEFFAGIRAAMAELGW
jgi:hypothetical protein